MTNIANITQNTDGSMQKKIDLLKSEFQKLRTGRAHPGLVEHVKVPYYGNETALAQVASITVSDPRTLSITPWDKSMVKAIEKALRDANLGLNPVADANLVRVPMPPLNEERRKELIKIVKSETEHAKVSIRNTRRDANNALKELLKAKTISEDEEHRAQDNIQKITDKFIAETDKMATSKEKELMEV